MPPPLPLTSERLERHGLFLIEDGQTIFLWIGSDAVPQLVMDVFNLPSYEVLRGGKVCDDYITLQRSTYCCCRLHFRFWITHSLNGSTLLSRRLGRCAGLFTIPTCTW
jgi:hypothetical protein